METLRLLWLEGKEDPETKLWMIYNPVNQVEPGKVSEVPVSKVQEAKDQKWLLPISNLVRT